MFKSWRLGRVLGFPVEINLSFLLLLAFVFIAYGGLAGVLIIGLAFGSVLLHELGHALVARKLGVHVSGIELSFLGGAAKMQQMPRKASHELAIAAAGPAVSVALGIGGLALAVLFHSHFLAMIGWINLVIAAFNMIPALPMDGGRILRALLTYGMDYVKATDVAVIVSRVVAVGFVLLGLSGYFQLLLLAPFLWMMGTREKQIARMEHGFAHEPQVIRHDGWNRRDAGGWGSPFDPRGHEPQVQRFVVRQRNGRLVVEPLD